MCLGDQRVELKAGPFRVCLGDRSVELQIRLAGFSRVLFEYVWGIEAWNSKLVLLECVTISGMWSCKRTWPAMLVFVDAGETIATPCGCFGN